MSVIYPKERIHSQLVSSFVQFAKRNLGAMPFAEGESAHARV
jgi:hypothetical protein